MSKTAIAILVVFGLGLWVLVMALGSTPTAAPSGTGTTNAKYIGCATLAWFDDAAQFIEVGDRESLAGYFAFGRCIALQNGWTVTDVRERGRYLEFRYQGANYYAGLNAVNH
jgi:hypothetical protein